MTAIDASRATTRRPRTGGGFSLIELVAVMVIVGILAGAAVVTLSSATDNRATMAAKQLVRDLTFARQRAVATGTPSWIDFDPAPGAETATSARSRTPGPERLGTPAAATFNHVCFRK